MRGRHRWHAEALLSLKRGLYSIVCTGLKKKNNTSERETQTERGRDEREFA